MGRAPKRRLDRHRRRSELGDDHVQLPNSIPLSVGEVRDVADRALMNPFERLYAGWDGDVIPSGAPDAIRRSVERYAGMVEGTWPRG